MHPNLLMYYIEMEKKNYLPNSKTYYYIAPNTIKITNIK